MKRSKAPMAAMVSLLAKQDVGGIDVNALMRLIVKEFGGYEGLAKCLRKTYDGGTDNVRARVLSDVMRLMQQVADGEEDGLLPSDPESLQAMIGEELAKLDGLAVPGLPEASGGA